MSFGTTLRPSLARGSLLLKDLATASETVAEPGFEPAMEHGWSKPNQLRLIQTGPGYTSGMKTAVSIPDDLFVQADQLAERMGKSRSEVYREALADYVARREPGAVTRALDEVAEDLAADRGGFGNEAARRTLERSEW